jgi:hypothetical protein
MRIGSNIVLRGDAWAEAIDKLKPIIDTFYGVYVIAVAIGIYSDKQIDTLDTTLYPDSRFEINSARLHQDSQTLDILFKSAIITTGNVAFSEDFRMELAFNDDTRSEEANSFNQMGFLTKFANYGVTQLAQRITGDPLENIEALNKYIIECADGLGFDDFDLDDLDISESDIGGNQ